jgi:hypothetical protein
MTGRTDIARKQDRQLVDDLTALVTSEFVTTAEIVLHIAEVDARKLYAQRSYPSMFSYCVDELGMSEGRTCRYINVARAASRYPRLAAAIGRGELHLTGASLLAAKLSADNHVELIDAARRKSKRQIEQLIAERFPRPDAPSTVRKLPGEANARRAAAAPQAGLFDGKPPRSAPQAPRARGVRSEALSAERYKYTFRARARATSHFRSPIHPGWRRSSSLA